MVARSRDAVLWIDAGETWAKEPSKVLAYLENDVSVDSAARGVSHRETGRPAQTLTGRTWLGRFHTVAGIDLRARLSGPDPVRRPPLVERSLEALNWTRSPEVVPAQFTSPIPAAEAIPAPQPTARSVSVRSRSNVPMQAKSFPGTDPQETILAINSGVQIIVRGIENVPAVQSGVVSIEADRVVIWTTALAGLSFGGEAIQQAGGRWEFYLEGNIIFREGDRVIYADRMYYDANENRGTVLNAEMLTPVPSYEGLVRLKADVLQQLDRQNFLAHGGALTSSRLGVPSYWFQSENRHVPGHPTAADGSLHGQAAIDPNTGDPAVQHELQAKSHNNFVYAGGWPLLYWPVMATDLTKPNYYVDRVQLGSDRVFGNQVRVDWDAYQILGHSRTSRRDEMVGIHGLAERAGFRSGLEVQLRSTRTCLGFPGPASGFLNAWGIQEQGFDDLGMDRLDLIPEAELRGRIYGQHRQMLRDGYQFTGELGVVSDINFLEQYYEAEWDQLKDQTTGIDLKRYVGNRTWDIAADVRINPWFTQTEWLPRFDHFLLGQSLLSDRLTWLAHSHVGYARLQIARASQRGKPGAGRRFHLPALGVGQRCHTAGSGRPTGRDAPGAGLAPRSGPVQGRSLRARRSRLLGNHTRRAGSHSSLRPGGGAGFVALLASRSERAERVVQSERIGSQGHT